MTMSRQQVPSCLVGYDLECCVIPCLCGQLFDDNVQVNSGVSVMSYRKWKMYYLCLIVCLVG